MSTSPVDSPLLGWGTPPETDTLEPLNNASSQLEASRVIKSGPGKLYGFTVTNTNASAQFVQVWDSNTVPADGESTPILSKSVPGSDSVGFSWLPARTFLVGIVLCNSSTIEEKTIGSADCLFDAQFL